jgi:hypothetical protein
VLACPDIRRPPVFRRGIFCPDCFGIPRIRFARLTIRHSEHDHPAGFRDRTLPTFGTLAITLATPWPPPCLSPPWLFRRTLQIFATLAVCCTLAFATLQIFATLAICGTLPTFATLVLCGTLPTLLTRGHAWAGTRPSDRPVIYVVARH